MRLRDRLTALFAAILALPLVLALLTLYAGSLESERRSLELSAVEQLAASVERELQLADQAANLLATNPTVQAYLSLPVSRQVVDDQFDEMNALRNIIRITEQSSPIYAIRFFLVEDKLYVADQTNFFSMETFEQNPLFAGASVRSAFTPVYAQTYLGKGIQEILSCIRLVKHATYVMQTVGAVAVDVRAATLLERMQAWRGERLLGISLVDFQGAVLVSDDPNPGEPPARGYTLERDIAGTQWRLVARFSTGLTPSFGRSAMLSSSLYVIAGAAVVLALSMLLVRRIASRIGRVVETFANAERGLRPPSPSRGIFAHLDRAVDEAQQLLLRQQEQAKEAMTMELKLLQAQINPHFLYNALDSIGWMIKAGRAEAADEAIVSLARYLRLALSKGSDVIPVEQETEMARLYAWIQQQRTEGAFELECVLDEDARDCLLPKMTLQPILENAILHGHATRIDIDVYVEEEALVLSVSDNGVGMDPDRVEGLLDEADPDRGYGLSNVHQRIRLFSDNRAGYGVSVESEPGKYTTFTLRIARIQRPPAQDHKDGT